jgi:imidazole glycerol-phosphate synthase subunit HisF
VLKKRLLFTLLMQRGAYMLSRNFRLQAVGDLNWLKEHYDFDAIAFSIDELVVLNVERGDKDVAGFARHLTELVHNCFVPLAAGGGIRSMDDAFLLLGSGADKLVVNTPLVKQPELVRELVKTFGSQCVVASIDYKRRGDSSEVFISEGGESTGGTVEEAIRNAEDLGVGEIYLTCMDLDGTGQGYDLKTIQRVAETARVPLIASGGVGQFAQLADGIERGVSAVSTAHLFNFMADGLIEARAHMKQRGIEMAQWDIGWKTARTAIFVTARMSSSRLPDKMFTDIEGQPALWYVLDRLAVPKFPELRIVCTSTNPQDDQIAAYAEDQGWQVFRGDEEDVLNRYLQAAAFHGVDFFVNVDGDDLFCDPEYVDKIVQRYRHTNADYIYCEGLPFGGAPIGVKTEALREVCARKNETKTEGWGKYFLQSGLFKTEKIDADEEVRRPHYRMTLDYPEDVEFFRTVVRELDPDHQERLSLREVVSFLDVNPEIAAISEQVSEQYWERFNRQHGQFSLRK